LDKTRSVRIVVQEMAKLSNGGIDAVFGIDEDFARPQPLGDFGARNQLSFARDQEHKEFHGLAFDAQGPALMQQLKPAAIQPEIAELVDRR
jgi:hypothetical protein